MSNVVIDKMITFHDGNMAMVSNMKIIGQYLLVYFSHFVGLGCYVFNFVRLVCFCFPNYWISFAMFPRMLD
jgi:hypothetical protein